jgi:8-oxo-dGTP diphosphatase
VASNQLTNPDTHKYRVIPRVLVFAQHHEQVLLLKGAPDKPLWPNLYNGLGGHVEPHETIYGAAARELAEESGIHATTLTLCGMVSIYLPEPRDNILLFIFTCQAPSAEIRSSREGTLAWFGWDDLPTEALVTDLTTLLPLIRNLPHNPAPFYGLYTYDEAGNLKITLSPTG